MKQPSFEYQWLEMQREQRVRVALKLTGQEIYEHIPSDQVGQIYGVVGDERVDV
jgi:hypothetical protein